MSTASDNIPSIGFVGCSNPGSKDLSCVTVARDLKYPSCSTSHVQWNRTVQTPLRIAKTQVLRSTVAFEYALDDAPQDAGGLDANALSSPASSISSINQGGRSLGGFKGKVHAVLKNLRHLPQKVLSFSRTDCAHNA